MAPVGSGLTGNGLLVEGGAYCGFGQLGITGFSFGVYAYLSGTAWGDGTVVAASGNNAGFQGDYGGVINATPMIATGSTWSGIAANNKGSLYCSGAGTFSGGNGDCGFWAQYAGYMEAQYVTAEYNTNQGFNVYDCGVIQCCNTYSNYNVYGYRALRHMGICWPCLPLQLVIAQER